MMFIIVEYRIYLFLVFESSQVSHLWLMVDDFLRRLSLYFVAFCALRISPVASPRQALLLGPLSLPDQKSNSNCPFGARRHP